MATRQIHELDTILSNSSEDQLMISTAAENRTGKTNAGDLQVKMPYEATTDRGVREKLGDAISVKDFGAVGDGISDDSLSFQRALNSSATAILIPEGKYVLTEEILVPPRKTLLGSTQQGSVLVCRHPGRALVVRAPGSILTSVLQNFKLEMEKGSVGIEMTGDFGDLRDITFSSGTSESWAIDLVDANNIQVQNVRIGGLGDEAFFGNGIRWRNSDPVNNPNNYGNGCLHSVTVRLASAGATGIELLGAETRLIANILLSKIQISASSSGAIPYPASIGIKLQSCVRSTLQSINLEALEFGIQERGISDALGASVANQYLGVHAINVDTPYTDSNGTVSRSEQQRTFLGCDKIPAVVGLEDGDTIIPAGLWLQSYVYGENAVRFRCFSGHEMIVDDGADPGSLAVNVGGSSPRVAPNEEGMLVRLYLGRNSSSSNNTMRDVTVEPVLRLAPRHDQNPAPTAGQMIYADGTNWDPGLGEGFYFFERGSWRKVAYKA